MDSFCTGSFHTVRGVGLFMGELFNQCMQSSGGARDTSLVILVALDLGFSRFRFPRVMWKLG